MSEFLEWFVIAILLAGAVAYLGRLAYRRVFGAVGDDCCGNQVKSKPKRAELTVKGRYV